MVTEIASDYTNLSPYSDDAMPSNLVGIDEVILDILVKMQVGEIYHVDVNYVHSDG